MSGFLDSTVPWNAPSKKPDVSVDLQTGVKTLSLLLLSITKTLLTFLLELLILNDLPIYDLPLSQLSEKQRREKTASSTKIMRWLRHQING